MIAFTVLGRPQPAGSKRGFALKKAGEYTGRVAVSDANPNARAWKQEVKGEARRLCIRPLLECAVRLEVQFILRRPKGHFRTGRNSAELRPSAPAYPIVAPDVTKLVRAVEDALTGVVWRDDAQVVQQIIEKRYGEPERIEVFVSAL